MLIKAGYLLLVGAFYVAGQTVSSEAKNASEETNSVPDVTETDSEVNDFKQSLSDFGKKIVLNKVAAANEVAKWATATSPFSSLFVRDFNNLEEQLNTNRKRLGWLGRDTDKLVEQLNKRDLDDDIAKWAPTAISVLGWLGRDTDKLVEQLNKRDLGDDIAKWGPTAISVLDWLGRDTDKLVEQMNKRDLGDEKWMPTWSDIFRKDVRKVEEQVNTTKRDSGNTETDLADDILKWVNVAKEFQGLFNRDARNIQEALHSYKKK